MTVFRNKIEEANRQLFDISKVYHENLLTYHKVQGDLQEAEDLRQMQEDRLLSLLAANLQQQSRERLHMSADNAAVGPADGKPQLPWYL